MECFAIWIAFSVVFRWTVKQTRGRSPCLFIIDDVHVTKDRTKLRLVSVFTTPPAMGERSIVMSESVCVFVCLSVRDRIFGTTDRQSGFYEFKFFLIHEFY